MKKISTRWTGGLDRKRGDTGQMFVWVFSVMGCGMLIVWSIHGKKKERKRWQRRNEMYHFVIEVQNHFQYEPDIINAIECALSNVHEKVSFYQDFLDVVMNSVSYFENDSDALGEVIEDFLDAEPEWYEKIFLFMCMMVESMEISQKLFQNEMSRLCLRLEQEQRADQRMHNSMSGTAFAGIIPCLMLPLLRRFSIENLPQLKGMYDGIYGFLTLLLIAITLCVSTGVLEWFKRKLWEEREKKEWELICWQSIFIKETYRADVELLFDWLLLFSSETKNRLLDIRSAYEQFGCENFLDEIWCDEKADWEKQMLYAIQNSDRVGMRNAFGRKEQELESGHKKEDQRKEQVLRLASSVAPVISFVPFYVTIGFYLIVPFVTESMKQLSGILTSMDQVW